MIDKKIIENDFFEFMANHDTTWASISKAEPLCVMQIYFLLNDLLQSNKVEPKQPEMLNVEADSEFLQAINGKDSVKVWTVIDDLMDTLKTVYPQVYKSVIKSINEI